MPQAASITVKPNGQTLVVNFTGQGSAVSFYSDSALTASVTLPYTVTTDTTFYTGNFGQYTISVKQPDGTELDGSSRRVQPDVPVVVEPQPTAAQIAADNSRVAGLSLAPSGALAETFSRGGGGYISSVAVLTSGQLYLAGITLPAGLTVTNITFVSTTTAANLPTNYWFALYSSGLVLRGQTADQTTAAWGSNTAKTLALTSPYTTTSAGLHYLGIMVAATTPPTLAAASSNGAVTGVAPKLVGTSTGSLTTTAPDPAAAITAGAYTPYAYVS